MPLPSILGVFGHPDDESLLAGGILAQHAAAGASTAVVTATWAPDSHRTGELADALAILGAGEPRMLDFADAHIPDSAPGQPRLCDAPIDEIVRLIVGHIRTMRPEILITHDAYGQLTSFPVKWMCSGWFPASGSPRRGQRAGAQKGEVVPFALIRCSTLCIAMCAAVTSVE